MHTTIRLESGATRSWSVEHRSSVLRGTLRQTVQAERRRSSRFPIEREVRYRALNKRGGEKTGEGKTINISSSGVFFTAEHLLLQGRRIELSISWPAQLNNRTPLKLVVRGRVTRTEDARVAVEIQHYEFRTQSSAPSSVLPGLGSHLTDNSLELYSIGRLDEREAARIEEHLAICEECFVRLAQTDDSIAFLRAAIRRLAARRAS